MNQKFRFKLPVKVLLAVLLILGAGGARAQIIASDDASAYNTWTNGMNQGFGFTPWILTDNNGNGSSAGFFIGGSGGIDVSNNSFGLYANAPDATSDTAYAIAYRGFSNSLATSGQVFKVKFQNTAIISGGFMGFCLRSDNNTNFTDSTGGIILDSGTRFAFYFAGGDNDYFIYDGSGSRDTGIGFTGAGLSLEFYLLDANDYLLIVKSADGSTTLGSFSDLPLAGGGGAPIITFAGFNEATGPFEDAYFNSLEIAPITLIPPQISNVVPPNDSIYWQVSTNLSFKLASLFSTIPTNTIALTLNGVAQPGLTFSGSASNVQVTLSTPLQTNTVYMGTITAADANGNHTTNNFTFNTWLTSQYNLYVESGDYNFNSGFWIDNLLAPQPNQAYANPNVLLGSNTIDYLEYDTNDTEFHTNVYRPGDLPQVENTTDQDHDNFAANSFQPYDLGFNDTGTWLDYTRHLVNTTYAVYARMAGFSQQGGSTTMLMERAASAEVNSPNQPRAAMGTFVCPSTGGVQSWAFVPLTDFFSNPVQVRLPGTNTFRLTCLGPDGSYNFEYLVLVAITNKAVLHPYIASGYPFPNATGVSPDQPISFAIANQLTNVVNTGSIKLLLNSVDVTSSTTISNNAAGVEVTYEPVNLLSPGTNTLQAIYSDGLVSLTNQWSFDVITLPVIPSGYAVQLNSSFAPGFAEQIAKAPDLSTNIDFPNTVARSLSQLAGTLTNSQTGQPYPNLALGPNNNGTYTESNTVNYDITGQPSGSFTFVTKTNFPYVPAAATNNYIALAADMYVQLTPGVYSFAVRSDDGFELTTGPTPASTNMILGIFDQPGGRSDAVPTTFSFIVQVAGLYPMQLIYDQGQFGGNIEFYSIDQTTGTPTLINDPTTPDSIKVYHLASGAVVPIPLTIQRVGTNVVLTWSSSSFSLQSAPTVSGTYTTISTTSPYTNSISGGQKYFRLLH